MIEAKAESHFRALDLTEPELSVLLTDNDAIRELNNQWREIDAPTDVLSFPLHEAGEDIFPGAHLGDLVISVEYAESTLESEVHRRRIAESLGVPEAQLEWTLEDEVGFLVIHGILHLVGHDHGEPDEEAEMKAEELRLWRGVS